MLHQKRKLSVSDLRILSKVHKLKMDLKSETHAKIPFFFFGKKLLKSFYE